MSRSEELRAKFKAKGQSIKNEMESPFGQFRSKLNKFVSDLCNASSNDEFANSMHALRISSMESDLDEWFMKQVKPLFISIGTSPEWRFEPDWLFLEGKPMIFVAQYDREDETFYIFEGRRQIREGWVGVIRMSAQRDDAIVLLQGEIVG